MEEKRSKMNSGGLCECHMLSKLSLMLIGKYNRPACFANQTCSLKYAAQKCAWMDIPACWKWFNEVFYSERHGKTCHPVYCLWTMINGRGNALVRYFTDNVTSWKQPCDLGIIAAVKKRYKCLLLKDVQSFYQLDSDN